MANCVDHLGNEFNSITKMCEHYKIKLDVFYHRIKRLGWSLKKALTEPLQEKNKGCKDHTGQKFNSEEEMCDHWGISVEEYKRRIATGEAMESALTRKKYRSIAFAKDHLGNKFDSILEMCNHYGVKYSTFHARIESGKTLSEALTNEAISVSKKISEEDTNIDANTAPAAKSELLMTGINNIEIRVFPYYTVRFDNGSERIMTIGEIAEAIIKMNNEAIGSNLLDMRRQAGFLTKSPSINEWLELDERMTANC